VASGSAGKFRLDAEHFERRCGNFTDQSNSDANAITGQE